MNEAKLVMKEEIIAKNRYKYTIISIPDTTNTKIISTVNSIYL